LDIIFIILQKYNGNKDNEILYVFSEKVDLRLENKFHFLDRLIADNKTGTLITGQSFLKTLGKETKATNFYEYSEYIEIYESMEEN